jgi:hypothetical protein
LVAGSVQDMSYRDKKVVSDVRFRAPLHIALPPLQTHFCLPCSL